MRISALETSSQWPCKYFAQNCAFHSLSNGVKLIELGLGTCVNLPICSPRLSQCTVYTPNVITILSFEYRLRSPLVLCGPRTRKRPISSSMISRHHRRLKCFRIEASPSLLPGLAEAFSDLPSWIPDLDLYRWYRCVPWSFATPYTPLLTCAIQVSRRYGTFTADMANGRHFGYPIYIRPSRA